MTRDPWQALGSEQNRVELVPTRPSWGWLFAFEAARIRDACGPRVVRVEWIGSTSVPSLLAKPILDLMPGIRTPKDGEASIAPMEALGYEYKGEFGIPGRFYFVRRRDGRSIVHAHFFPVDTPDWERHLLFRDRLRRDPATAAAYAALKSALAVRFAGDREAYTKAKTGFIERVVAEEGKSGDRSTPTP
ncbi:MAG: GrpB family protein [Candidatus Eisenbacteria bacterium]